MERKFQKLHKLEKLENDKIGTVGTLEHRDGLTKKEKEHMCRTVAGRFTKQCERTNETLGAMSEKGLNWLCVARRGTELCSIPVCIVHKSWHGLCRICNQSRHREAA